MTAYRVSRSLQPGPFHHGEPGPEGVHQDAATLTVIVLLNRRGLSDASGGNRVWSLQQPSGKPTAEDIASGRLLWSGTLRRPFDALFVLDREAKHEALPIEPRPRGARARMLEEWAHGVPDLAVRDVLTFEVRWES